MSRRPPRGMTAEEAEVDWDQLVQTLLVRADGLCEARTEDCLAGPDGHLARLPRNRVSVHHRKGRGIGGTRRLDVEALHHVLLVCGDGVAGCHGWIGKKPTAARARGLIVWRDEDATTITLTLHSGRRVALGFFYEDRGYDLTTGPVCPERACRADGPRVS